jgi:hypothetical protein
MLLMHRYWQCSIIKDCLLSDKRRKQSLIVTGNGKLLFQKFLFAHAGIGINSQYVKSLAQI